MACVDFALKLLRTLSVHLIPSTMLEKLGMKKKEESFFGGMSGDRKSSGSSMTASAASVIPTFNEEPACAKCCPKLTYQQRLYGFVACAAFGYLLSFIGTMILVGGVNNTNIRNFAILYVLGNVSFHVGVACTVVLCLSLSHYSNNAHIPIVRYV